MNMDYIPGLRGRGGRAGAGNVSRSASTACSGWACAARRSRSARCPAPCAPSPPCSSTSAARPWSRPSSAAGSRSSTSTPPATSLRAGQTLFEVYSPELNVLQQEFAAVARHAAADRRRRRPAAQPRLSRGRAREAAPRRAAVAHRSPYPSPAAGTVVEKMAVEGMRFQPGETLFRIVDTSIMWVMAEVYEQDLAFVKVGDMAQGHRQRLARPALRRQGHLHLSHRRQGKPHGAAAHRGRQSRRPAARRHGGHRRDRDRRSRQPAWRCPNSAVIDSGKTADRAGRARRGPLRAARRSSSAPACRAMSQVLDGLKPGERVVTLGHLPDRRRKQPPRGAAAPSTAGRRQMIAGRHPLVGAQPAAGPGRHARSSSAAASMRCGRVSLDAIPDLSDTQVIVYTEMPGQAPQVVEDQVTYPLTTAMLAVPRSRGGARLLLLRRVVRLRHLRGRHRHLLGAQPRAGIPQLAAPRSCRPASSRRSGPDATGVGWVYQYVVVGANRTLAELRSLQDWYIRFALAKAEGVAEVASVGGFVQAIQRRGRSGEAAQLRRAARRA